MYKKEHIGGIFLVFIFFVSPKLYATAQWSDIIIYNGERYPLFENPLEYYFSKYPEKRPKGGTRNTALWRGYIATFEIINNELLLKDIEIEIITERPPEEMIGTLAPIKRIWKSVLPEFFDGETEFKMNWFNGFLVIPEGELINYIHMGYESTYEKYLLLEIRNGIFFKEYRMDYIEYEEYKAKSRE